MTETPKHDLLQVMRLALNTPPESVAALARIVSDLQSAFPTLGDPDSPWTRQFQEHWAALEGTYAFELEQGVDRLDAESLRMLSDIISELRASSVPHRHKEATMAMKMPRILLDDLSGLALVVPCKSGVVYQNQVGGNVCYQEEQEGVLVPLDLGDSDAASICDHPFPTGSRGIEIEAADLIDAALRSIWGSAFITVDRTRLAESWEAWVHVTFLEVPAACDPNDRGEYYGTIFGFPPGRAVLTWQNSD